MPERESAGRRTDTGEHPGGSRSADAEAPTHLDLLEQARALQDAAFTHDVAAVHDQLAILRQVLADHLEGEDGAFEGLSPAAVDVVVSGQRHLMERIDELLGISSGGHADCHCIEGASRITSLLRRQARLESGVRS